MTRQPDSAPVLEIEDLTVAYQTGGRWLEAVRQVSLRIQPGQTYGLVGESGSGKTSLAMAVMRYLPTNGKVQSGRITFAGRDLLALSENELRGIWGARVGLVPQDPLSSLNPSLRVGEQLAEVLRRHTGLDAAAARSRAVQLLRTVRLPDPERVADSYPHQLSGGMQQRVLIAMALSTAPRLLVLDEPTTSLDVTTQASILTLLRDLIQGVQTAVLYVTHNLGVVAQICDRVAVLYAGELVEDAPLRELFRSPLHPYTRGLLDSVPRLGQNKSQVRLQAIQGRIPDLAQRPGGCVFVDRCPLAIEICRERPPLYRPGGERSTRCHRWEEIASGDADPRQPAPARQVPAPAAVSAPGGGEQALHAEQVALDLQDVKVHFELRRSLGGLLAGRPKPWVRAVDGVSLPVGRTRTVGLVGESGSGKTTLARAVVGLEQRTGGRIDLFGLPLPPGLAGRDLDTLRHLQMVFQNPEEAFNPYLSVGASLRRPLVNLLKLPRQQADEQVRRLLAAVRLPADYARRMPGQLSGGEKQRIAIARAFASHPDLLVADEPVSSLDVSVQASILNLLGELQIEHGSAMLFISHDLAVVGYLADDIAVIYLGRLMEFSRAEQLFQPPYHPYTEALLSAIPVPDPARRGEQIQLEGDIPSPLDVPPGCPFHTRCPRTLGAICVEQAPPWQQDGATGKRYYCHIPPGELRPLQKPALPPAPTPG